MSRAICTSPPSIFSAMFILCLILFFVSPFCGLYSYGILFLSAFLFFLNALLYSFELDAWNRFAEKLR